MGSSSTDGDAAVTAPATPRTDALHFNWKGDIDMQRHELLKLSRTLERELTERTEQLAEAIALGLLASRHRETAEANVARLKDLVGRCRPAVKFAADEADPRSKGVDSFPALLTEIDKEIKP